MRNIKTKNKGKDNLNNALLKILKDIDPEAAAEITKYTNMLTVEEAELQGNIVKANDLKTKEK